MDGLRLLFILKTLRAKIKFRFIAQLVFINIFISNITPFATGGGFAQIYFLNKKGVPLGSAVAATTIRTVLAMLFFFIGTPLIILFEKNQALVFPKGKILGYAAFITSAYLLFFYMVIKKNRNLKRATMGISLFLKKRKMLSAIKYKNYLRNIFKALNSFSKNINLFFKGGVIYIGLSIIFTLLFLLALFMFSVILIAGLGYQISAVSVILLQVLVTFLMYFAPTPGASGIAEGGYAFIFKHFVKGGDIVPLTFAWRFFTIYIGLAIGAVVFYTQFIKMNLRKNAKT